MKKIKISEKAFESQVKSLAKIFGWRYYHTWRSIHSPAGFPDCVLVRPPRLIFAELKSEKGKPSPEQEGWLEDLRECVKQITFVPIEKGQLPGQEAELSLFPSLEVYLWRPKDIDQITLILR